MRACAVSHTLRFPLASRLTSVHPLLTDSDEMELGRTIVADVPPDSRKRLASRPKSAVWTDDLATHRRAPRPPTVPKKDIAAGATATRRNKAPIESTERRRDESSTVGKKDEAGERSGSPAPSGQQRKATHHRSRPSYPPVSPSQRAREVVSASPSPPRALSPRKVTQASEPHVPLRPPSPRPTSPPAPSFPFSSRSILDRPRPGSRPRSRSVSPPASVLVTPTEATFVLPAIPFPVPQPTPPTSPMSHTAAAAPRTPTQASVSRPLSAQAQAQAQAQDPTPTQKSVQHAHRPSLHSLVRAHHDDMKLASSPGRRPVQSELALVLVKSRTPTIYDCAASVSSRAALGLGQGHGRAEGDGDEGPPAMCVTSAPPPASPSSARFSFAISGLFPPSSPRKPKHNAHAPSQGQSAAVTTTATGTAPHKLKRPPRPPRQRRVSAEASQWAWGAKRTSSAVQAQPTNPT